MQGLPYTATEDDVAQFFEGIKLLGVYFTHGPSGRRSGNAFAEFQSDFDLTKGLSPNKQHIWAMCVWRGHGPTTAAPAAAVPSPALSPGLSATLSPVGYPPLHFVRLRGLPYDCQAGDIKYFFRDGGVVPLGVFLSIRKGEAFAEFASGSECAHALSLDRGYIGRRYVEIFMSSPDEVSRFAQHPPPPLAPQKPYQHPYDQPSYDSRDPYYSTRGRSVDRYEPIESGGARVHMVGLPYRATTADVLEFFSGFPVVQGSVEFGKDDRGRPSGEA
jgi:heterogeneous nuclear ribonucleoprotein F/H